MKTLAALALILLAAPAFAADAVVSKVSGKVYIRADGADKDIIAKGGEELLFGDAVKTGPGALAQIELDGRGAVLLRENSAFMLQGNAMNTMLRFQFGEFLIGLRKALGQGESFRVRTPSAVAAVRGTLFWGKSDEKKTTTYAGFGHAIAVTAKGKTVIVNAGETTTVALDEAPAEVKPSDVPFSYTDAFRIGGSLSGLEDLAETPASKP